MAFYGYQPQAKNYSGIGAAISQVGAGIGAGIEKAVEASKNWENMEYAIKGIRANYKKYGTTLMEKEAISPEQYQAGLDQLRMPTKADKKNPEAYIKEMQARAAEAYKVFAGKEDLLLKQERSQTVQRIGAERTEGLTGLATTGTERIGAPAQTEGAAPGQFTSEGAAPGFQTYQPSFEQKQLIEPAKNQEGAIAGTERGLMQEGQAPLSEEETRTVEQIGGLPTREELAKEQPKEGTELQKKRLELDEAKFAHQKAMDTIKAGKSTPQNYDKVLDEAIDNKFKAKGVSRQYSNLIKAVEGAVNKAKGGVIDQMVATQLMDEFKDAGETPPEMTVPALEKLLPEMEKAQRKAVEDTRFFEEVVKRVEKSPKPTLLGAHREAREKMSEREFPAKIEELNQMKGFAKYGAQDQMLSSTGEINISHPKIQEAIKQKLRDNYTIEEIAKGLQEETAHMGTQ